jgi:hypothetical protein
MTTIELLEGAFSRLSLKKSICLWKIFQAFLVSESIIPVQITVNLMSLPIYFELRLRMVSQRFILMSPAMIEKLS